MGDVKNLNLSPITLGTMRFKDKGLSQSDLLLLLEKAHEKGITSHHSSHEYSSYELYTSTLKQLSKKKDTKHIVKIAAPHFEDDRYRKDVFIKRVEDQLTALDVEQIDVLQWLVRSKPINDTDRLNTLEVYRDEINDTLHELEASGKVKTIFSFPYSVPFSHEVIKINAVDGLIAYLNINEIEYSNYANKNPFIAIRSLQAGQLLKEGRSIQECLDFVAQHKGMLTQIVSINSLTNLQSLITES